MSETVHTVTAPLMGTFYRASGADQAPFVEVGQQVAAGATVCIIESMKIFTELRADQGGTVQSILVDNEEAVMKNQPLIEIVPDG